MRGSRMRRRRSRSVRGRVRFDDFRILLDKFVIG